MRRRSILVDVEDLELLTAFAWRSDPAGYLRNRQHRLLLHRLIMQRVLGRSLAPGEVVDHRNGNNRDNQRCNLRLATMSSNGQNRGKPANNTSGYKGVSWSRSRQAWLACIAAEGVTYRLGRFDDPEDAAYMYDQFALVLHGEFARTNFLDPPDVLTANNH